MREKLSVKIDNAGRVVIPQKIRKVFSIEKNDLLSIKLKDNSFLISKDIKKEQFTSFIKKIKTIELLYDFDIIIADKDRVVYTSEKFNNFLNFELDVESKEFFGSEVLINDSLKLFDNCIFTSNYYYSFFYLDSYTKFLIIISYKNIKEEKIVKLVLKLFD